MYDLNLYSLPTIDFVGGSTQDLRFKVFFYANKKAVDVTNYEAEFSVVDFVNRDEPIISKPMSVFAGGEIGSIPNILQVILTKDDTLLHSGKYIYQITIKDTISGQVDIPKQGIMHIINNIDTNYLM